MTYHYPYRYRAVLRRARYGGRMPAWQKMGLGLAAAGALAGAGAVTHHHHHHGRPPAAAAIPAGDLSTRLSWARAFLRAIPEPRTACNVSAVVAWETREGGGFGNQAAGNPLNLNPGPGAPWPGSPAIGAWAFPDAATGLAYTVQTVRNYGGILGALSAGNNAQAVCDAIMASPWAASHYNGTLTAEC